MPVLHGVCPVGVRRDEILHEDDVAASFANHSAAFLTVAS